MALCRGGAHQRICFSGIGSLSHHVVSGPSSQVLSGSVAELFIPFLQQEGNSLWPGEHAVWTHSCPWFLSRPSEGRLAS